MYSSVARDGRRLGVARAPAGGIGAVLAGAIIGFAAVANLINMPGSGSGSSFVIPLSVALIGTLAGIAFLGPTAPRIMEVPPWLLAFAGFIPGALVAPLTARSEE